MAHLCSLLHEADCWKHVQVVERQTAELPEVAGQPCAAFFSSEAGTCSSGNLHHVLPVDELLLWRTAGDLHRSAVAIASPAACWSPSYAVLDWPSKFSDVLSASCTNPEDAQLGVNYWHITALSGKKAPLRNGIGPPSQRSTITKVWVGICVRVRAMVMTRIRVRFRVSNFVNNTFTMDPFAYGSF